MSMRFSPGLVVLCASLVIHTGCSKDGARDIGVNAQTVTLRSSNEIRALVVGENHLLVIPSTATEGSVGMVYIIDWGYVIRPDDLNVTAAFDSLQLEEGGKDLVLERIGASPIKLRFSVTSPIVDIDDEIEYVVAGLSKLSATDGFDLALLNSASSDDAFDIVASARGGSGEQEVTKCACASGGPGSTSCTITNGNNGNSCSVACGSGRYACCDIYAQMCRCCPN